MNIKMRVLFFVLLTILLGGVLIFNSNTKQSEEDMPESTSTKPRLDGGEPINEESGKSLVSIFAKGLEIPWDIAHLPNGEMLVTERSGRIVRLSREGMVVRSYTVPGVRHRGEGGLLGILLHPEFEENNFVYVYVTRPGTGNETVNSVERYRFENSELLGRVIIINDIPGAQFHNGGRMEFGPDGKLYVTTGDATNKDIAQDIDSLGGKILRFNDDGSLPEDNPFGNFVYSYGHRNPQGLAWDEEGRLWSTEHGPSSPLPSNCCRDELNLIKPGNNYGWPEIKGDEEKEGMEPPVLQSGKSTTWAPASAVYYDGSIFFGGLKGERLYEAVIGEVENVVLKEHFVKEFGRIRTIRLGPDGIFYLTTSNQDGRGNAREGDDKILRIDPRVLRN